MIKRPLLVTALLSASLLFSAGCETGKQKKEAYQHWNATRAQIQANLSVERYKLGNLDDARKSIDEALKLSPENAGFHVISARIYIEKNQLDMADRELELARKLDSKNAEADYLSGVVYQRWQKPNLALEHYSTALAKAPNELPYLMAKAEMLMQLNRLDEAVVLVESKLTFFEYSGPLRDMLGGFYLQQNKVPQAIDMLHQATILSPDDATIREHLARTQFRACHFRDALEQFDLLLKLPDFQSRADVYMLKGECHLQLQQLREARVALETSLEKNPSAPAAQLALAKVAMKLDDLDRAEACVRKALAINAEEPQSHLALGYIKMRRQQWDQALVDFTKAHKLDPKDPTALCMIGLVWEKKGDHEQALNYYGQALQIKPNDPLAKELLSKAQ